MVLQQEIRPAVAAVIFNENGEVLLQRRRDVGQWCIISGHVEFGETVEAAILREIREEINVAGHVVRLIGVYSSPASQTYHYNDRTVQYVTSYFEVQIDEEIGAFDGHPETIELGFFLPDRLPSDFAQINPHWLKDALDKSGTVFIR